MPWPALIAAGGSLLGGLLGKSSAKSARKADKHMMQNKIAWTVADAKRSGISPLAALGSPASGAWTSAQPSNAMGDAVAQGANQLAQAASGKKSNALQDSLLTAQIRRTNAETSNLIADATSRSNIARLRRHATSGPSGDISDHTTPTPLRRRYVGPHGSSDLAVGPEWDELLSGAGIDLYQMGGELMRRIQDRPRKSSSGGRARYSYQAPSKHRKSPRHRN